MLHYRLAKGLNIIFLLVFCTMFLYENRSMAQIIENEDLANGVIEITVNDSDKTAVEDSIEEKEGERQYLNFREAFEMSKSRSIDFLKSSIEKSKAARSKLIGFFQIVSPKIILQNNITKASLKDPIATMHGNVLFSIIPNIFTFQKYADGMEFAQYAFEAAYNELFVNVASVYNKVILYREKMKFAETRKKKMQQVLEIEEKSLANGHSSKMSIAALKTKILDVEYEYMITESRLKQVEYTLEKIIGIMPPPILAPISIDEIYIDPILDSSWIKVAENNLNIKSAEKKYNITTNDTNSMLFSTLIPELQFGVSKSDSIIPSASSWQPAAKISW